MSSRFSLPGDSGIAPCRVRLASLTGWAILQSFLRDGPHCAKRKLWKNLLRTTNSVS